MVHKNAMGVVLRTTRLRTTLRRRGANRAMYRVQVWELI